MILQREPSTTTWSIQRRYLCLGWSNVYNIHSMIHCCSTLELIFFVKNKSKTNPTGNSFSTSVHWFFVSYLMCYQEAFNVETVHVKILHAIWSPNNFIPPIFGNLSFSWWSRTYIAALEFKKNRNGCYAAPISITCICTREIELTVT